MKDGDLMKLFQARIVTRDVPALVRFYRQLTGLTPVGDDVYAEFHGPRLALAISSERTIERHGAAAATAQSNRSVILDFEVADVGTERARLSGLVATFVLEPTTQPWGNRAMLFRDPDGNLINVFTPAAQRVASAPTADPGE
jgi:catechol 2,3-dioxygenase-like lactoylglutathione lyase family enzyme